MDETYLKIKGENSYLYRAADSVGNTIDFFVSKHRDKDATIKIVIHERIYSGIISVKATLRK
ncbi:MAG: insertion sequence protein [Firmicutes bacterium]|nr:insertion sequence protein [Bacillota bacterium]